MPQAEIYLITAVETLQICVGGMIKYVTSRLFDSIDMRKITDDLYEIFAFSNGEIRVRLAWCNRVRYHRSET